MAFCDRNWSGAETLNEVAALSLKKTIYRLVWAKPAIDSKINAMKTQSFLPHTILNDLLFIGISTFYFLLSSAIVRSTIVQLCCFFINKTYTSGISLVAYILRY